MSDLAINKSAFLDPAFSSTADLLKVGKQWANEGGMKWVGAHTVIPPVAIASAALDTLVQALSAVINTAVFIPGTVVYIASFGKIDFAPTANLSTILQHTARAGGDVAMIGVIPLTSFFSCDSALAILDGLKLAPGVSGEPAPTGVWANFQAQEGLKNKAVFILNNKQDVAAASLSAMSSGVVAGAKLAHKYNLLIPAIGVAVLGGVHYTEQAVTGQSTLGLGWTSIESNVTKGYTYVRDLVLGAEKPPVPPVPPETPETPVTGYRYAERLADAWNFLTPGRAAVISGVTAISSVAVDYVGGKTRNIAQVGDIGDENYAPAHTKPNFIRQASRIITTVAVVALGVSGVMQYYAPTAGEAAPTA